MCKEFVNLHNHTDGGSFDSVMKPSEFAKRLKALGQKHMIQTDHGTLRNMVDVHSAAQKAGLLYSPGCEFYVCYELDPMKNKKPDSLGKRYYHMLCVALNNTGVTNLYKLIHLSHQRDYHYYYKPRLHWDEIVAHSEGLFFTSGCMASRSSNLILEGRVEECEQLLITKARALGDRFMLEVQDCGVPEQDTINQHVMHYGKKLGIPIVATSDAHFATPEQGDLRTMTMSICHGNIKVGGGADGEFYDSHRIYLKSGDELAEIFGDEAVSNSLYVAKNYEVDLDFSGKKVFFPTPHIPEDFVTEEESAVDAYLRNLAWTSMKARGFHKEPAYVERIEEELATVRELGFSPYFLVMKENLDRFRNEDILIGAGRGSVAGSLLAYLLDITQVVDPLKYGLLFSRFLNKSRVSWPDIDIDIPSNRRAEALDLITEHYGADHVCQIITFSSFKPKVMARDIGRYLGDTKLGAEVADLIPPKLQGRDPTVSECLKEVKELHGEKYRPVVEKMIEMEGLTRHTGVHAAGVIISPVPLQTICPIENYVDSKAKGKPVRNLAQVGMDELEKMGLIKMDFLGLRTLDIIQGCVDLIKEIDHPLEIPLDDPETMQSLRETHEFGGLFQFEGSPQIGQLLHQIQPHNLEDLAAATALYRPGPLGVGLHKKYVENKRRYDQGDFVDNSITASITKNTYGCLIYQEQLIQLCCQIAGFSEVDGDNIRKVLGKKKQELVEQWRAPFVEGCAKTSGLTKQEAEDLFANISEGSSYLFNKSHAVAYSVLSYWCAYLRHYHTAAFMAAVLNASVDKKEKLSQGIGTCHKLGIKVLPPTLEQVSKICIPVSKDSVRLGLNSCRYLKKAAKYAIQAGKKKPRTLTEFVQILDKTKLTVLQCKALAQAGFLDTVAKAEGLTTRRATATAIEVLYQFFKTLKTKEEQYERWEQRKKDREQEDQLESQGLDWKKITGRNKKTAIRQEPTLPAFPVLKDLVINTYEEDLYQKSIGEYEILGICIDDFPTDYMNVPDNVTSLEEIINADIPPGKTVRYRVAVIVSSFKEMKSKSKRIRGVMVLEDASALVNAQIPSFIYEKNRVKIDDRTCILADLKVKADVGNSKDSEEDSLDKRIDIYHWEKLDVRQECRGTILTDSVENMISLIVQGSHESHIVMGPIEYRGYNAENISNQ